MSFGFLSFPLWMIMCVSLSLLLIFLGIKRHKIDRPALIITYFTIAADGLLVALNRFMEEMFMQGYQGLFIAYSIVGLTVFIFIEIVYMSITTECNGRSKKLLKFAALIVVFSVIPLLIWIVIDLLLQNKL